MSTEPNLDAQSAQTADVRATPPTLVDRERSNGRTEWIVGRSPWFLSHYPDGDELWFSRRPFQVNVRVHKFPAGNPTLEEIDQAIAEATP